MYGLDNDSLPILTGLGYDHYDYRVLVAQWIVTAPSKANQSKCKLGVIYYNAY